MSTHSLLGLCLAGRNGDVILGVVVFFSLPLNSLLIFFEKQLEQSLLVTGTTTRVVNPWYLVTYYMDCMTAASQLNTCYKITGLEKWLFT